MAKQSLEPKTSENNLPAVSPFVNTAPAVEVQESPYSGTPYVVFYSGRMKNAAKVTSACPDVEEGDPVLILPDPYLPVKLNPFRFFLVAAFQHWSIISQVDFSILRSTLDCHAALTHNKKEPDYQKQFVEHIESVIVVLHNGKLIPARCCFKGTKANAGHKASDTLKLVSSKPAEWFGISPAHAATQAVPFAWGRFVSTVRLRGGTGKTSGRAFVAATSVANPSTVAEWKQLTELMKDTESVPVQEQIQEQHSKRIAHVKSKVG